MWLSVLRIHHCHRSHSGCCYGKDLIPGLGTSLCCRCGQKRKKKNCNQITAILQCHVFCSIFYFCSSSVFIYITIVHSFSLMYSNPPCECTTIYFYFIVFQGATPVAYGSSLATAASLHHSSQQLWILNPPSEARDQTHTLMILVVFITAEPQRELLYYSSLIHSTLDGHLVFSLSSGLL